MPVPEVLGGLLPRDKAEVLVQQGQLYPNRRLFPVQLRGIAMEQSLLNLPLAGLKSFEDQPGEVIPAVVGVKMARKAHLKKGDKVVLKWRDKGGAVDARDILIVDVGDIVNPRIDDGVVWLRLDHLRSMTDRDGEVSWVAVREYDGRDLLYFTNLLAWRCGVDRIRFSVNGERLGALEHEPCHEDEASPNALYSEDILPYLTYPLGSVQTVTVEVSFPDGSEERGEYQRGSVLIR